MLNKKVTQRDSLGGIIDFTSPLFYLIITHESLALHFRSQVNQKGTEEFLLFPLQS